MWDKDQNESIMNWESWVREQVNLQNWISQIQMIHRKDPAQWNERLESSHLKFEQIILGEHIQQKKYISQRFKSPNIDLRDK